MILQGIGCRDAVNTFQYNGPEESDSMKYKEIIRDIAAAGLIAFSFWSVFYPEFTFATDAYQKIEDGTPVEADGNVADYYEILEAGEGEVTIRFSFMEKLMPEKADEAVKQTQAQKETSAAAVNGKMSEAKAVR